MILGFLLGQADLSTLTVYSIYFKQIFSAIEETKNVDCFFKGLGSSVFIVNPYIVKNVYK